MVVREFVAYNTSRTEIQLSGQTVVPPETRHDPCKMWNAHALGLISESAVSFLLTDLDMTVLYVPPL